MSRRVLPRASAVLVAAAMALGAGGMFLAGTAQAATRPVVAHLASTWLPAPPGKSAQTAPAATSSARRSDPLPQVVLPDLFAVAPRSVTAAQFRKLGKLRYVRDLTAVDGGGVKIKGHIVAAIGVNTRVFRAWTPPQTASSRRVWSALARGELMTTAEAARKLGLHSGKKYRVLGARQAGITWGGAAAFGIPGVDTVVNSRDSRSLGLLPSIGVLLSAPGANLVRLEAQVRSVLGRGAKFVDLRAPKAALGPARQTFQRQQLPVDTHPVTTTSRPGNYLELFQESARLYCPGLSWTVLAAIGQIESGDGQNTGPSSAGAQGPMQFLPSTWARWGITAFGETGPPNINDPYDAVPAAAEYLCSYNPAQGGAALSRAIYGYNHAAWYVAEVLALAHEYAQEYG